MANDFNLSGTKCIACPYEAQLVELTLRHQRILKETRRIIDEYWDFFPEDIREKLHEQLLEIDL